MARSKDLDTIAPDDLVVSKSDEEIIEKPIEKPIEQPIEQKEEIPFEETIKKEEPVEEITTKEEVNKPNTEKEFPDELYGILGHTKTPFSSFLVHPKVFTFVERDEDEEIYLAVRPHPIINLSWILLSVAMFFVPFFFRYFTFLDSFPIQYQFSLILFWYLITFIYAFQQFLSWYFNLFVVTNQRVVDIGFTNLLNKHFAEADLSMIQDVSSSVRGIFGTFLNFGDVLVQTASEINQITFEKVPNPEKIIRLLKDLRELEEEKGSEGGKKNE